MWGWWQTGDNLATLCGGKERQRCDAAFFYLFSQKKNLGPTGFDPRTNPTDDWKSNTLTTTLNFPAIFVGSGDANTRENQIVLFLPLDGSATGPFRWTIPLRLIVHHCTWFKHKKFTICLNKVLYASLRDHMHPWNAHWSKNNRSVSDGVQQKHSEFSNGSTQKAFAFLNIVTG